MKHVRYVEGSGLVGELHFNPEHPLAKQVVWDAQHSPRSLGLSHDVAVRSSRDSDGKHVIDEINRVDSVDLVANPATTDGLFESVGEANPFIPVKPSTALMKVFLEQLEHTDPSPLPLPVDDSPQIDLDLPPESKADYFPHPLPVLDLSRDN